MDSGPGETGGSSAPGTKGRPFKGCKKLFQPTGNQQYCTQSCKPPSGRSSSTNTPKSGSAKRAHSPQDESKGHKKDRRDPGPDSTLASCDAQLDSLPNGQQVAGAAPPPVPAPSPMSDALDMKEGDLSVSWWS